MNEANAIVSSGWSSLSTIDDFDMGTGSNKNIITTNENFSKSVVKSLFIESLVDQLCKFMEKDTGKRKKLYQGLCSKLYDMQLIEGTYNVEELASLRGYYQQAILDVMMNPDARFCSVPCIKFGSSRYATEYEEMEFIASGGFGKVFKAKNRLDQVVYAVKKIPLKYENVQTFERKLNEVKTLAKLNHPNIVQYKAAWLEPLINMASLPSSPEVTNFSSTDSDIVVFQSTSDNTSNKKNLIGTENNLAVCKYSVNHTVQKPLPQISALLYVTMHLCDETLSEWLHHRNLHDNVTVSLALHIMIEATRGVQYIHNCNIIHHDLKPRNIFLSYDLKSVAVGDFGLSCCLQEHDHSNCPLEQGQFGTQLYAAPEQLKGCCDSKSDMFSLGLIFVELLTVFSTEMERVKTLTKARSCEIPSSIPLSLVFILKKLISHKPSERPSAEQLLNTLIQLKESELYKEVKTEEVLASAENNVKTGTTEVKKQDNSFIHTQSTASTILEIDKVIKDKDREIIELKQMLVQRENEIAKLKQLVSLNR